MGLGSTGMYWGWVWHWDRGCWEKGLLGCTGMGLALGWGDAEMGGC